MSNYRYKAFISYSWADAKWGKWLHHAIETYRTPAALVGKQAAHGEVPARLHPLFKDREEEAAGTSIGAAVEKALTDSEFLIVICSPRSAQSQWVNREIAWFKKHRNPNKVLALIVDGEPGGGEQECFPRALTHEVAPDLTITDTLVDTPLAADARDSGDGKRRAKLKIAAAMLGVRLDELVNRDERRRTLRTRIVVAASLLLALVMSTLAWVAVQARDEAERQRAEADGLIEFMLTDLREKLEPVGRLDALDVVGQRALDYYAAQKLSSLDADSLGRRSRALHLVGEIRNLRGDSAAGLAAFEQAAKTTGELLERNPDDAQRVFDHAQSVFWVGAIAFERGETKQAEAQFREYQRLAARLVALDPAKPEWQLESSYAETNLGVMLFGLGRFAEAEPFFVRGVERIEAVAKSEGYDAGRQIEVGATINWLGRTRAQLGKIAQALSLHRREAAHYEDILRRDPANAPAKYRLAVVMQFLAEQELNSGKVDAAIDAIEGSLEVGSQLRALEPDNTEWQETEVRGRLAQAEYMIYAGRFEASRALLDQAAGLLTKMIAADPVNTIWSGELKWIELGNRARLALALGENGRAQAYSDRALALLDKYGDEGDRAFSARMRRVAGDIALKSGDRARARQFWEEALALSPSHPGAEGDKYILLKRLGRSEDAMQLAERLDRRGYRHPAYLRER